MPHAKVPYLPWEVWAMYTRTDGLWKALAGKEYLAGQYSTEDRAKQGLKAKKYKHVWAQYEIRYNPNKIAPKTGMGKKKE